jgi:hypothetical protein
VATVGQKDRNRDVSSTWIGGTTFKSCVEDAPIYVRRHALSVA